MHTEPSLQYNKVLDLQRGHDYHDLIPFIYSCLGGPQNCSFYIFRNSGLLSGSVNDRKLRRRQLKGPCSFYLSPLSLIDDAFRGGIAQDHCKARGGWTSWNFNFACEVPACSLVPRHKFWQKQLQQQALLSNAGSAPTGYPSSFLCQPVIRF